MLSKIDRVCKCCSLFNKEFCFIVKPDENLLRAAKDCPCRNCLIKIMCSKVCDTRFDFYAKNIHTGRVFKEAVERTKKHIIR